MARQGGKQSKTLMSGMDKEADGTEPRTQKWTHTHVIISQYPIHQDKRKVFSANRIGTNRQTVEK